MDCFSRPEGVNLRRNRAGRKLADALFQRVGQNRQTAQIMQAIAHGLASRQLRKGAPEKIRCWHWMSNLPRGSIPGISGTDRTFGSIDARQPGKLDASAAL